MPSKRLILAAALAGGTLASAASAQRTDVQPVYSGPVRPDMPAANPRMAQLPPVGPREVFSQFGSWSRSHGNPRILLFWNRELGDDTTTLTRDRKQGVVATAVGPGGAVTAYDETQEKERTTGLKYTPMTRAASLDLESSLVDAFLHSGANVLDRAALMRKVSTRQGRDDRSDQQFVEATALEQGVDYLVEVLPDYHPSTTGYMFTVKITHLPTSRLQAQFRTAGTPLPGESRLVARPGGYVRERDNTNTPTFVAEALAAEIMRRFY